METTIDQYIDGKVKEYCLDLHMIEAVRDGCDSKSVRPGAVFLAAEPFIREYRPDDLDELYIPDANRSLGVVFGQIGVSDRFEWSVSFEGGSTFLTAWYLSSMTYGKRIVVSCRIKRADDKAYIDLANYGARLAIAERNLIKLLRATETEEPQ